MVETQSNTPQGPTGDIKIFIDTFNTELDIAIKDLSTIQASIKEVYNSAISIDRPRNGPWPNDPNVITIGDLFKYTFPDINSEKSVKPSENNIEDYSGWLKDLKNNKDEDIRKVYYKIYSGISSNSQMQNYQDLKKPGITNPNLWSPGQYYFDVFMSQMLSPYGPLKDPTDANGGGPAFGSNIIEGGGWLNGWLESNGGSASVSNFKIEDVKGVTGSFGYSTFYKIIDGGYLGSGIKYKMRDLTGVSIGLGDQDSKKPTSFAGLFTQYRSGLLSELIKDSTFQRSRGDIYDTNGSYVDRNNTYGDVDLTGFTFNGNYEHILLYKAFIQAGDNYKPVVLPVRELKVETSGPNLISPPLPVTNPDTQEFTFNVEKKDTFIVVGGTVSPPLELVIVPNDGTEYIFEEPKQLGAIDDLSDEYTEGEFLGNEEDIWAPPPPQGYPSIDTDTLNSLKGVDPENPGDLTTDSNNKYPTSKDKDANIKELIKQAKKAGVTNKYAIVAILAIISKESGFIPKSEFSYRNTSGARCVKIFGRRGLTDQQWDELRKDDVKFFNFIYGNKYGNGPSDGYKYRGRGLNQITFKAIYEKYGKATGYDIVGDPDLLNTITVAAACAVEYFKTGINGAPSSIKNQYNFTNINSFSNLNDATGAIYHCNAGFGHSYASIVADSTGGRKKAFNNAGPLYNSYSDQIA